MSGDGEGQRGLEGYSPWGSQRVGHDWVTEQLYPKELNYTHQMGESYGTGIISNKPARNT